MAQEDQLVEMNQKLNKIINILETNVEGTPGLIERVNALEKFQASLCGWMKSLVVVGLANVGVFAVQLITIIADKL